MKHEDEIEQVKRWIRDTENNINTLNFQIERERIHLKNQREILKRLDPNCDHTYSKAMNQPSPRLCIHCGEPEEMVFVQTEWQLQQQLNCTHMYSRSINQPYPRLCVHCGKQEEKL